MLNKDAINQFLLYEDYLECPKKQLLLNFYQSFPAIGGVPFSYYKNKAFLTVRGLRNELIFLANEYICSEMGLILAQGLFEKITVIVDSDDKVDMMNKPSLLSMLRTHEDRLHIKPIIEFLDINDIFVNVCKALGATAIHDPQPDLLH